MKIPRAESLRSWVIGLSLPALAVAVGLTGSRLAGHPPTPPGPPPEPDRPSVSWQLPAEGDLSEENMELVWSEERGHAVYRFQVVPGGVEVIVDPLTGMLLEVRAGPEKQVPTAACE